MSNSNYTGDPCNVPLDKLRLLIPDRSAPFKFTDAELQCFLDDSAGDTMCAAICAADVLVGHYADCVSKSIGKVKIENQQKHEMWRNRLRELRIKKYGSEDAKDCAPIEFRYNSNAKTCGTCCKSECCCEVKKPVFGIGWLDGSCCD